MRRIYRILHVEDEFEARAGLQRALRQRPFKIMSALDGIGVAPAT